MATSFVVPAGGGKHLDMSAPGRFADLKLLREQTADSIMLFEESLPAGTKSTFHLHHHSDEVAWVLEGEMTFRIGDDVSVGGPGTCAFLVRNVPHAWKNSGPRHRARALPLHPGPGRRLPRGDAGAAQPDGRREPGQALQDLQLGNRWPESAMTDDYQRRCYGEISVGTGEKPGIVVVDFQLGFTDPQYPLGGAPLVMRALENTARLLEVARRVGAPVAVCNTAYMNEREMPYWKITAVKQTFLHDHPSTALDPRIYEPSYDLKVTKKGPSIFFETGVANYFMKERVDTMIVTGCNTSGCIRGSALNSFSHRFRTLVPEDCVGDIEEGPHRDNLRDIGRRYVDVTDLAFCIDYLERWGRRNAA